LSRAPRSRRGSATGGFTLIEVVVALALIAVSLVSIGALMASNIRSTRALEQHAALIEVARAVTAGLPDRTQLVNGATRGAMADHEWRIDVAPFPLDADEAQLPTQWRPQKVTVRVQAPSGQMIELQTVRLQRRSDR